METPQVDKPRRHALLTQIEDLRHRGFRGGYIQNHRALLTSPGGMAKVVSSVGLALVLLAGWLLTVNWASVAWAHMLSFWSDVLGIRSFVTLAHYRFSSVFSFSVPYLYVQSPLPGVFDLVIGAIVTVIVFISTFFLPRRYLPVAYLLRVVVFFQACAQVFFTFVPMKFPYGASGYVHGELIAGLVLIALVPVALAFTYFIFDFSLWKKATLALIIMLYFFLMIPMQFLAHAYALHHTSLLMLPLLFFVFGLPLDVMIFIAFYSWGASWKNRLYREPAPRGNGFFETQAEHDVQDDA